MVWGSDWPHRGEKEMPDDATLFDLLTEWAPTKPCVTASWLKILKLCTASPNQPEF
jgi:predicted TIM-barrel fold metal-dependent hydrolase